MREGPEQGDPVVLSYLALRTAVGVVALALPFAVSIPYWLHVHMLEGSISSYYYTGMRNLFVGSLCALGMFMLCCRGYDWEDEAAGIFSAICSIGVAFFPTSPDSGATLHQVRVSYVHYSFAAALFLTLAYFCLVLFKRSSNTKPKTAQKKKRNVVYTICGIAILASLLSLVLLEKVFHVEHICRLGTGFVFETTSLVAFGVAWLIKGETFLKDTDAPPFRTRTTDGHVMLS